MEAKRRYFGWLLHLMGAACLMAGLAACTPDDVEDILNGDTNSEEKKDDTKTDKNSVTVTANGAKVTRGDFSINFPKGTFSKDAKVTVVEAKKGDICGEDEISAFYKVTMPVTTHKPNTIKIKCGTKSNDIFIILHSSYLSRSIGKITESNYILPTTYSDGEYTSQISAIENGVDTESDDITIGLARIKSIAGKTRGSDDAIAEGEV